MIRSNILATSVREVLWEGVADEDHAIFVVNPSRDAIRELVVILQEAAAEDVRLFAAEQPLKDLMDDFIVASAVSDLVESETLAVRTLKAVPNSGLLVSEESVTALVEGAERAAGLATTDDEFVAELYETYARRWEDATPFALRTPPLSTVMETLESDIGADVADDFEVVLDSMETARGEGDGLDEVTTSLLVAARNEKLLYDISKWGEDIGLASKATFSRTKTRLEDAGVIDTEKVPIDVGRPRLRLLLGDGDLESTPAADLAGTVRERLP
jgi:hypothetical protein